LSAIDSTRPKSDTFEPIVAVPLNRRALTEFFTEGMACSRQLRDVTLSVELKTRVAINAILTWIVGNWCRNPLGGATLLLSGKSEEECTSHGILAIGVVAGE
jgi:hypothetical protein